jgi:superfamily II DNA/RNA helicase
LDEAIIALQVVKTMANIRPVRQTLFFSATFPKKISDLARKTLADISGTSIVAPEITQVMYFTKVKSTLKTMMHQH